VGVKGLLVLVSVRTKYLEAPPGSSHNTPFDENNFIVALAILCMHCIIEKHVRLRVSYVLDEIPY
jgi:hypothetical protein